MGLYNNVPTFTYVSATGITVTYNEEVYTVQSFYTNKKYIYWDYDNATVLQASNTMPTRSFKTFLVLINDNGIATTVPSTYEGFEISYSGDTDDAIKSRIYALYQKDKELGDKYVAIEQDVNGIRQIVGSSENPESGTLLDRVSKVEQTSEDIKLSVSEVKKVYNDDKENSKLRDDLNSSIIKLNANLGTFNSEIYDYYKDNKISSTEKTSIETMVELIKNSKSEVLVYANKVKLVASQNNDTTNLNTLNSAISALETSHTNFINNVTTSMSDGVITPSEKTVVIDAIAKYTLRVNELKSVCDDIILLGFGGIVVEKLSQITMNSNEIKLSVSNVESTFTNNLNSQKLELQNEINQVSNSLGTFKQTVETTFKDGIIDEAEKKILTEKIEQLEKEKLDVEARYTEAYNNKYLISPYNTNLKSQYDRFNQKHLELKNKISQVISSGTVSETNLTQINTLFNEYSVILSELKVVLDNSLDIITTNKANEEILNVKKELSKEISDVNSSLENVVDNLDELVKDGVVDTSERKAIEASLLALEKEKVDVDAQYKYWSSNSYLTDPLKSQYKQAYNNYTSKYNTSISIIKGIINKEGLVNDTDKQNMTNAHTNLSNTLSSFVNKTNEVIEFTTLKQYEDLISLVEEDISDVYNKLGELDIVLDGTFENNIIDQAERKVLKQNLTDLKLQKTDIDTQYTQLYKSTYLTGTIKTQFKSKYDNFVAKYNSLVTAINTILNKSDLINDTDRNNVSTAHTNLNTALGEFVTISNSVMDAIAKAQSDELKEDFDNEMNDLNDRVDSFSDDVYGAFKDGILNEAEKKVLKEGLNELEVQKNDIVVQYNDAYNNVNLTNTTIKSNLKTSYDTFITKYNNLVSKVNSLLSKTTNITTTDKEGYSTAYNEYKASVKTFSEKFYEASKSISDKAISDVRSYFNKEVSDLNNAISNLDSTMNGIFKDGILSDAEKISIREQLAILEREKADVDANHSTVYANTNLTSTVKSSLNTAYNNYSTSYNSLVNIVNSILNKTGIISSSEQTSYKNALVTYKGKLSAYTQALSRAVDDITTNSINKAKQTLQSEINDVIASLGDLESNMNDVFRDGVLSDAEKTTIKQRLETIKKEKGDVDNQYTTIYNNASLVDTTSAKPKSELKTAYDNFVSKYNALVTAINNIVNKTTIINDTDRTNLTTALNNYRTASSNYMTKATSALDAIAQNKANNAANNAQSEAKKYTESQIKILDDSLSLKVTQVIETANSDKQALQNEINSVLSSLGALENNMNVAFRDGVLSDAEKTTIKQQLETIKKEKVDVDKQYTTIYSNTSLVDTTSTKPKSELKTAYDNFVSKYNSLVSVINTIVSKTTTISNTDRTNLSNALTNYSTASSNYMVKATNALDSIAQNKATSAGNNALSGAKTFTESQIEMLNNSLTLKVTEVIQSETVNLVPNSTAANGIGSWRVDSGCNIDLANNSITDRSKTRFIFFNRAGDTILIEDINGKNILVDGGYEDDIDYVINGLKDMGVKKLDYIILTHFHSDHCGGTPRIISEFLPSKIYIKTPDWTKMPSVETEWETRTYYNNVISACSSNGVSRVEVSEGLSLNLGQSSITFYNTNCTNYSEYNNISYGFLYKYGNTKSFFAGDMTYVSEKNIKGKIGKVDLLKLGHHGISGSTSDDFIKELQPSIGVFTSNYLDSNLHGTQDNYKKIALYSGRGYSFGNLNPNEMIFEVYNDSIITSSIPSKFSEGWFQLSNDPNFYYFKTDGMLKNSWVSSSTTGIWYYLGVDGIMKVNSFINHIGDGNTYYVGEDGGMVKNKWVLYPPSVGSYYWMDANGVMVKNSWVLSNDGFYYYLKSDGKMATSEKMTIGGVEYEFNANGTIKK